MDASEGLHFLTESDWFALGHLHFYTERIGFAWENLQFYTYIATLLHRQWWMHKKVYIAKPKLTLYKETYISNLQVMHALENLHLHIKNYGFARESLYF